MKHIGRKKEAETVTYTQAPQQEEQYIVWEGRKCTKLGLPLYFTYYTITNTALIIERGILRQHREQIMLYRILDIGFDSSLIGKLCDVGTIHIDSSDRSSPHVDLYQVKYPREALSAINEYAMRARYEEIRRRGLSAYSDNTMDPML
jgi:hypothetical protein